MMPDPQLKQINDRFHARYGATRDVEKLMVGVESAFDSMPEKYQVSPEDRAAYTAEMRDGIETFLRDNPGKMLAMSQSKNSHTNRSTIASSVLAYVLLSNSHRELGTQVPAGSLQFFLENQARNFEDRLNKVADRSIRMNSHKAKEAGAQPGESSAQTPPAQQGTGAGGGTPSAAQPGDAVKGGQDAEAAGDDDKRSWLSRHSGKLALGAAAATALTQAGIPKDSENKNSTFKNVVVSLCAVVATVALLHKSGVLGGVNKAAGAVLGR